MSKLKKLAGRTQAMSTMFERRQQRSMEEESDLLHAAGKVIALAQDNQDNPGDETWPIRMQFALGDFKMLDD